ncbi:methylmalonyl-CoA mutase [Nakamurella silvestris]|nr:methylmalonyl-CoA mutase [Nakamurella silvestris]
MDALKEEWPLGGVGRARWEKAAAAVLRRSRRMTDDQDPAEVADLLSTRTLEGVRVPALGTAADLPVPPVRVLPPVRVDGWDIRIPVTDPDRARAERSVLTNLERGGSSLWVTVGPGGTDPRDLAGLLAGVFLDFAPVVLQAPAGLTTQTARAFLDVLDERELIPAAGSNLGADPIGHLARGWIPEAEVAPQIAEIAGLARHPGLRAFVVDTTVLHNAGSGQVQELAYSLAAGVTYLRLLTASGVPVQRAVRLIEFRYAATDDQFLTIASLRAARRLWNRVTALSGVPTADRTQLQHAVTSWAMTTRYDPFVNMLRTTVAAFAAGTGGADAVTVLPYDTAIGVSDDMANRVARNTSSLLISESHVAKVADPAGGSYAVEELTDSLARAAWAEFQLIESEGGILASLAGGGLAGRVAATAAARTAAISHRRMALTGVSEFPLAGEVLLTRPPLPAGTGGPFAPHRYAETFEGLRDIPAAAPVFLAPIGSAAAHTARATFAANLLAAGGIEVVRPQVPAGADELVAAFRKAGTTVAAVVGTDADYAEHAPELITALRAAGATWILLAGKPRGALADLVDDHVVVGADAITFLTTTRAHLTGTV